MQSVWYESNGEARDVLHLGEWPHRDPAPGEVLVRLATTGVNPSDVKSRRARPLGSAPRIIPHSDGAGTIEAVGEGVAASRMGQRVWIWNGQWQRPMGTAAQFITLPSAQAVPLPDSTSYADGACMGIPGLTAVQALQLAGDVAGLNLLVTGAGSAVGHYVTQLATLAGARVIGTAGSAARIAHARAGGAAEVIDYKKDNVAEQVKALTAGQGADVVIDMDFSTTANYLAAGALRPHGRLIGYGSNQPGELSLNFRSMLFNSLSLQFFLVYELSAADRARAVARLNAALQANMLRHSTVVLRGLERTVEAHELVEAGATCGNVVVALS
jgi:NADPH2:quinone reductase